ncbi:hypothetical protein KPH14_003000 [Odynerus spinipes]|uniref:Uncharacterized protein n=1 Tax=Odynerus spinipes TaxID=1348599 RepID=A0AAD9VV99_9HYME|nr:hypothetical protein KPH14_003000 [Odynerus spinipes]
MGYICVSSLACYARSIREALRRRISRAISVTYYCGNLTARGNSTLDLKFELKSTSMNNIKGTLYQMGGLNTDNRLTTMLTMNTINIFNTFYPCYKFGPIIGAPGRSKPLP